MARHVSLRVECNRYSEELSAFLKDKDSLLVDVVKALKRITNEWRSWNHKLFGGLSPKAYVASVDQIFELLEWTEKTYPNIHQIESGSKSHWKFCVDTLKRYITIHAQMQRFYSKFVLNIYSPLTVYYKNKSSRKTIAALRKTLNNWSILQQTGAMINESCFTEESIQFFMEIMYHSGCRDFYLVLRLIPDLCMKAAECVHTVKVLLDANESDGFSRERAYIFEVWRPIQHFDIQTRWEKKLSELSTENEVVEEHMNKYNLQQKTISESLQETREKVRGINEKVDETALSKTKIEERINDLCTGLAYYKFKAKELKRCISRNLNKMFISTRTLISTEDTRKDRWASTVSNNSTQESTTRYSCLRDLPSSNTVDSLRLELISAECEAGRIQELLTSARNELFKIETELKYEEEEQSKLRRLEDLLEQEKMELEAKVADIEMKDRVLKGYMSRIKKNVKKTENKLPPIAVTSSKTEEERKVKYEAET
eukprot:gene1747-16231_t